jgi:hypothetical protein
MIRETADGKRTSAALKTWQSAKKRAGIQLQFKQLRKIGGNAIKRLSKSVEVSKVWKGRSQGVEESYDDGIFEPMNEAQKLWAAQLRADGIL